jgi:hypothetical protein
MVWIERNEEEFKLVWIDGYAPEYEQVLKKAKDLDRTFDNPERMEQHELYKELLSFIRYKYFQDRLVEKNKNLINCDTYYFTFQEENPKELFITELIRDELNEGERLGNNYSNIIFTVEFRDYNKELEEKVKGIYKDIINDFNFRIREPSTYKNIELYKRSCDNILSKMGQIYIVPSISCENLLEKIGFSSDSCGNY